MLIQYLRLNYIQYWVKGINEINKTEIFFIFCGPIVTLELLRTIMTSFFIYRAVNIGYDMCLV